MDGFLRSKGIRFLEAAKVAWSPTSAGMREPVVYEDSGTAPGESSISASETVERGLNELRLAALGILVAIALAVGFAIEARWWIRLLAGIAAFAGACFLVWWPP